MYVDGFKQKQNEKENEKERKLEDFFSKKEKPVEIEVPQEELIEENFNDVLFHWQAPEYEMIRGDRKWYLYLSLVLIVIIGYAVFTNSPIMAITFILIGVVEYIYINKEPRTLTFKITPEGVFAGNELYPFENIKSFWIFYEPPHVRVISLHTKGHLLPYVHIPVHDEDPVKVREILLQYLPEEKHEMRFVDTLERLLRL